MTVFYFRRKSGATGGNKRMGWTAKIKGTDPAADNFALINFLRLFNFHRLES